MRRGFIRTRDRGSARIRTLGVREEHDQAVDADAPSTGGRETVLEPVKGPSVAERQK